MFTESFGQWLKHKREDKGFSQAELARKAGMARATVSLYEKDSITQPRLTQLTKIARVLDIEVGEMHSAFASLAMDVGSGGETDAFEVLKGVVVSFDRKESNLTAPQREKVIDVLKLLVKGITAK
jgi:transcriptional regulator with XRE-family HTH domain